MQSINIVQFVNQVQKYREHMYTKGIHMHTIQIYVNNSTKKKIPDNCFFTIKNLFQFNIILTSKGRSLERGAQALFFQNISI